MEEYKKYLVISNNQFPFNNFVFVSFFLAVVSYTEDKKSLFEGW